MTVEPQPGFPPSRVLGECWTFSPQDLPTVIRVIDAIEGTGQPGYPDLYHRRIVPAFATDDVAAGEIDSLDVFLRSTVPVTAFTYVYATDPLEDRFKRIRGSDQHAVWWRQLFPIPVQE